MLRITIIQPNIFNAHLLCCWMVRLKEQVIKSFIFLSIVTNYEISYYNCASFLINPENRHNILNFLPKNCI